MRLLLKRLISPWLKPLVFWYLRKARWYRYKGLKLKIYSGVFHPGLFLSTEILLDFVSGLKVEGKSFLELGAGSGAIGFYAEKMGATVYLSDINAAAIEGMQHNKEQLRSKAQIVLSDLFESIQDIFDVIIINPPYYAKSPTNDIERAWFCGIEFEYFHDLFAQLKDHIHPNSQVYMILSEDCAIDTIKHISETYGIEWMIEKSVKKKMETNYIFSLVY